jgi:hypothetical protein
MGRSSPSREHAADQSLAAGATAAQSHHLGVDGGLIEKDKPGRIKPALLSNPAKTRPSDVGSVLLRYAQTLFLNVIPCRLKSLHKAVQLPGIRCLRIAANASSSVRSGCLVIKASSHLACSSSGDVLPPHGLASALPVLRQRCSHLTAALALISKCSAASRREHPLSTLAITRCRNSAEYGFGMVRPPESESMPTHSLIDRTLGILRFYSAETCSRPLTPSISPASH